MTLCSAATVWALALQCLILSAELAKSAEAGKEISRTDVKSSPTGIPEPSIATSLPQNGDPDGLRAALAGRGITYGVNYGGELFGIVSGGIRRGSQYTGLLEGLLNVDLDKLASLKGLTFHAHAMQLHGRGLSASHLGIFDPITNFEATPSTRLFEIWLEQSLLNDQVSVRFGQMRVDYDGEFVNAPSAGLFISASFGWPAFLGSNLPSGGVTYPIIAPGVRVKVTPSDKFTVLLAAYNDDPAGPCAGDPQECNNDGLKFRLRDNPFIIGEVQYKYSDNKTPNGLSGLAKIGGFADLGKFDDQRFGTDGLSLANPASNGTARRYHSNTGIYALIDQQIYKPVGAKSDDDGVYFFGRVASLPSDRNVIDFAFDAGLRFNGLLPTRPNDAFGFAVAYNRVSNRLSGLDRDTVQFTGNSMPIRASETVAELTYKIQIKPGLILQPDLQYIWRPGGKAAAPNQPTKAVEDALVLGIRSVVNY